MLILNIYVKPYLAEYARRRYPSPIPDVVQFPASSLVNHAIVNSLVKTPAKAEPRNGNLLVMVNEKICNLKDLDVYNYLTYKGEKNVGMKLLLDFDMLLHTYMDNLRYHKGIDYKDSAEAFVKKYHLTDLVTEEAMLKKHLRWKKEVTNYRTQGVQLKMNFSK
ncbi:MAG: hypothetical protein IJ719_20725 [Clostridia bacterium]|nr:hypothetical protein [Clostridia bacterium]